MGAVGIAVLKLRSTESFKPQKQEKTPKSKSDKTRKL